MTDCQLVITGPFGRIDLTRVRDWREWDSQSTMHTSEGETTTHSGWAGSFRTDRDTPDGKDLFGLLDASFFSQTKEPVTIYRWTIAQDGSVSTYRYDNARLSLAPGGVAFSASGRVRV